MPDKFDKQTRSRIMSKIRAKDTKAELTFRKALWREGLRGYRLHASLPGKPDIVFRRARLVIFIDGDFWHGYLWKELGRVPPKGYWQEKIQKNIDRDKRLDKELRQAGWRVLRFWEHEVENDLDSCINIVKEALISSG
jgi:DNA mismatch endonuclease (patch repair protein)